MKKKREKRKKKKNVNKSMNIVDSRKKKKKKKTAFDVAKNRCRCRRCYADYLMWMKFFIWLFELTDRSFKN